MRNQLKDCMTMTISKIFKFFSIALATSALGLGAGSCSMMTNDLDDCPAGLYVRFVYDYNTQRADMFKDHVGHVKLYVYDESGRKVAEKEVSNNGSDRPLKRYGYMMHFEDGELAPGRYRLQAVGMQRDWETALGDKGARYRRNDPASHTDLQVTLDHDANRHQLTNRHHVSNEAPLDTLWHTLRVMSHAPMDGDVIPDMEETVKPFSVYPLEDQYVTIQKERATYATISLVRDTKHLNVSIRQVDNSASISHEDFEVRVLDSNGVLAHDNELAECDELLYAPYSARTSHFDENGPANKSSRATAAIYDAAHYDMMFNRLVYDSKNPDDNARLQILNRNTGELVADINLTATLAQGRQAWTQYQYGNQEYLDREYDYRLDFILKGDQWLYCDVVINVLDWSKRIQNENL